MHQTENRDPGTLCVQNVEVCVGDLIRVLGEMRLRRVTAVFGKPPKTHAACRGAGAFPVGTVRWEIMTEATGPALLDAQGGGVSPAAPAALGESEPSPQSRVLESRYFSTSLLSVAGDAILVGFDSAWTEANFGALVAVRVQGGLATVLHGPAACSFEQALTLVRRWRGEGRIVLALDQPFIVPNSSGRRPVDAAVSHAVGRRGGGVQPPNTSRIGMFDPGAPIWRFLESIAEVSWDPFKRPEDGGTVWLLEVFPALATIGLFEEVRTGRLLKYNPERRRTFLRSDWTTLAWSVAAILRSLELAELQAWAERAAVAKPSKTLQDQLDAVLCLLVALLRHAAPSALCVVGDLAKGYMLTPVTQELEREFRQDALLESTFVTRLC